MGLISEIRARARHVVGPVLGICAVIYFAYHVVHGDRGLFALNQLNKRVEAARGIQAETSLMRRKLEERVSLLHPRSLDPDMLDERVRFMLNYAHPNDLVITTDP